MTKISVIVCTYRRPKELELCLNSLMEQTASSGQFEIIVIDNDPNQSAQSLVAQYLSKNHNTRYIHEQKIGLSHARNRGYQAAKSAYIAYIDDDSVADPNWIKNILSFIKRYPKVQVFGGPYDRYSPTPMPAWLPASKGRVSHGKKLKKLRPNQEWLSGTNIIFKRALLQDFHGFHPSLGMAGNRRAYGEETELQARIIKQGIDIYYDPAIMVKHLWAEHKKSLRWNLKNALIAGVYAEASIRGSRHLLARIYDLVLACYRIIYWLVIPRKLPLKRRLYFAFEKICVELGSIYGSLVHCQPQNVK